MRRNRRQAWPSMFNGSQSSSQHFLPHPVGPVTPSHKDSAQSGAVPFIGVSSSLRRLLLQAEITAPHLHIAALEGEAGTGKHLFAQTLHLHSELATHIFHRRDAREWLANETDISSLSGTLYLDRVDLLALTSQGLLLNFVKMLQNDASPSTRFLLLVSAHTSLRQLANQGLFLP